MGLALLWHAHEMVFGFAAVIVVGFLFTAGRAWTGVETPTGGALAALTALWLAGRLAMWFAAPPLAALCDKSEEHTSELQSLMRISYAVFCLKKKKITPQKQTNKK